MKHRGLIQRVFLFASATVMAVGCSGGADDAAFSEEAFEDESALEAESALEGDDSLEAEDVLADEAEELGASQQPLILPDPFPQFPPPRPFVPCALFCPFGYDQTEPCSCEPSPFDWTPVDPWPIDPPRFDPLPIDDPCETTFCPFGQCVDGRCE